MSKVNVYKRQIVTNTTTVSTTTVPTTTVVPTTTTVVTTSTSLTTTSVSTTSTTTTTTTTGTSTSSTRPTSTSTNSQSSSTASTTSDNLGSSDSGSVNTGLIIGIVIGALVLSIIIIYVFRKLKLRPSKSFRNRVDPRLAQAFSGRSGTYHKPITSALSSIAPSQPLMSAEPTPVYEQFRQQPANITRASSTNTSAAAQPMAIISTQMFVDAAGNFVDPNTGAPIYYDPTAFTQYVDTNSYNGEYQTENAQVPPSHNQNAI